MSKSIRFSKTKTRSRNLPRHEDGLNCSLKSLVSPRGETGLSVKSKAQVRQLHPYADGQEARDPLRGGNLVTTKIVRTPILAGSNTAPVGDVFEDDKPKRQNHE